MNKLIKQSKGLQTQIIQDWEQTSKKIIQGHFERKIASFFDSDDKNEQFQNLHKLLIKWAILTGVKPLPTDEEIRLFVEYIAEHFYRYSLLEIDNAFNLATAGKLDESAEHYQSFSVVYISKIINSYGRYIGPYIIKYKVQLEEQEKENNKPTEKEQTAIMLESILDNFDNFKLHYEETGEPTYNPFGYISYDFLKNLGVIDIDDDIKSRLLEEAKEMALEELSHKSHTSIDSDDKIKIQLEIDNIANNNKQERVMRICKNLGLIYYYENILKNNLSLSSQITNSMKKNVS